jgi:amidase
MAGPVHAFGDDALGDHDALGLAAAVRTGAVSRYEVLESAAKRAAAVDAELHAVHAVDLYRAHAISDEERPGPFAGVPTFVKDNTDLEGFGSNQGSEAWVARKVKADAVVTRTLRGTGLVPLGKSRLPEFGFNATTEFMTQEPARNPWDTDYSTGASSGGSAALVAAGVVPIAHANDGGGSIRIPAACCGLVGLKPTRGRLAPAPLDRIMPVGIVSEGVVTRSVRDTAHFLAAAEHTRLPAVGLVEGPGSKRLRLGLVLDSIVGDGTDDETRAAVLATAALLESLGHEVVPMPTPLDLQFADDFRTYWAMLAFVLSTAGKRAFPGFDKARLDALTVGLADYYRARRRTTIGVVRRLRRSSQDYAAALAPFDAVLTPVLAKTTPLIGHLSPRDQPFDQLFERMAAYVSFTPYNNGTGSPAVSLPMGATAAGLPIGIQLMGKHGDERTLLELSYELEAAKPFRRLS